MLVMLTCLGNSGGIIEPRVPMPMPMPMLMLMLMLGLGSDAWAGTW